MDGRNACLIRMYLRVVDEALSVLGVGGHGTSCGLLQALNYGGLASAILTDDQRKRLAKVNWSFIMGVKAADSSDEELFNRAHGWAV